MPFAFLHPWFWLGAAAAGAVVWLHLRHHPETQIFRFSTLRFLDDQPRPRHRPRRVQHWLLFLLRLLGLLLVVAAFAWPYRHKATTLVIRESRVYVLDNTLSHQAGGGFQRDRERVAGELAQLTREIQAAVIELTANPKVVVQFSDDPATARPKLAALSPSYQRGSYLAALRQAHALLANSLGTRQRIIFLGDNQANQWTEQAEAPPFPDDIDLDLPADAKPPASNVSLAEPQAQRVFLGAKSLVNFTVKLSHWGEARNASVTLRVNGQLIFNRAVPLEGQPESMLLQAQWEAEPSQWLNGEVTVDGPPDVLNGDDRVYFAVPPVREGTVALLAHSPYLRLALSPEIMRGYWRCRQLDPAQLSAEVANNQDAEVLCLESSYLQSLEARKLAWRYLTNGRGLLLLVNRATPVITGFLRELGFEAQPDRETTETAMDKFQYVFAQHPVFHPFLSPDYGNLLEVGVYHHPRLKAIQGLPLVFSTSGQALIFQGASSSGRLMVTAFGLDRDQTNWPLHPTFIPFLDLCLQNARPQETTPSDFEPAAATVFRLPPGSPVREVVLRQGEREWQRAAVDQGQATLRLPESPGLYTLTFDQGTEPVKVFSVNPSPLESQLIYLAASEVRKNWQAKRPVETSSPVVARDTNQIALAEILQQRYWWWLLMAGLAALFLESVWCSLRRQRA